VSSGGGCAWAICANAKIDPPTPKATARQACAKIDRLALVIFLAAIFFIGQH
jgi:hypothetical protein